MTRAPRSTESRTLGLRLSRGARTVGSTLAVTMVAASLLAISQAPRDAQVTTVDGADLDLAARSTCSDVLVVGLDGNGQGKRGNPGQVVAKVANKVKAQGNAQGRTVAIERVRYRTEGAAVMVRNKRAAGTRSVSRPGLRRWKKPIPKAYKKTTKVVRARLDSCPEQQVLLVGYAQGAAVAHRVLQRLDKQDRLTNVAGAVTIADPYRVSKSAAGKPLGRPAAPRKSSGLLAKLSKSVGDVPGRTDTFRVVSVCSKGDLLCNPNRTAGAKALRTSLSYAGKGARSTMKAASKTAWQQLSLWPEPVSDRLTLEAGVAFSHQLRVTGGSRTAPVATWAPTSVPGGISLTAEGLLSGTFANPGVYEVRYAVAGVSPATTAKSGLIIVTVRGAAGALNAGGMSTCEVRDDGTAWCWGRNDFGQLGDGTNTVRISPAQVVGTDWTRVTTGGSFTCGVRTDGTLWCWGLNNFGQLGGADKASSPLPRQVGTSTAWRDVSASWSHACGTQADGSLWCWGNNDQGQLGVGKMFRRSQAPMRVVGGQSWTSVSAGGWHTCATTTGSASYCWGSNAFGQVGDGTTTLRVKPAQVTGGDQFVSMSTTWGRSCGITAGGGVRCWGENANGELGNGNRANSAVPVALSDGGQTWAQVTTGNLATCASTTGGQVFCWGDNRYGQLGPAAGASYSTTPISSGVTATGAVVASGWFHFCASGGGCWGTNDAGQLGNGTIGPVAMPTEPAPPWGPGLTLTTKQVRSWGAKKIAQQAVGARPSVRASARRRDKASFEIMTFNVLGSQHTAPTGARPAFAPGRVRTEWAKTLIEARGASLIGLSEPQPDQITSFDVATSGQYSFYPGNTMGYEPAPQSVMWKDSEWEFVWGNTAPMPFMGKARPQPVVRLRQKSTGQEVYWINAHLSPGKLQADRDKGLAIIVELIKKLSADGLPVMVTGDLNEHGRAFRKIACANIGMKAAVGGRPSKKNCGLPKGMRVDWVFGKRGTFSNTLVDTSPQVKRTTDHAVVSSRFTVQ